MVTTTKRRARRCGTPGCVRRSSSANGLCRPCTSPPRPRRPQANPRAVSTTYGAVHVRVRRERGPAAEQPCAHCGEQAADWAYDHTDEHPLVGATARGTRAEYSADTRRYVALCRSCHTSFDRIRRAQ